MTSTMASPMATMSSVASAMSLPASPAAIAESAAPNRPFKMRQTGNGLRGARKAASPPRHDRHCSWRHPPRRRHPARPVRLVHLLWRDDLHRRRARNKQVALGPLAVEAGHLRLPAAGRHSSAVAELHGRQTAERLVRFGFVPLVTAIVADLCRHPAADRRGHGSSPPGGFAIILGRSRRLMAAGIIAYGVSMMPQRLSSSARLRAWRRHRLVAASAPRVASVLSQIVDTLIFITVAFYGVFPIGELMLGQMLAKVVLSIVLVPLADLLFARRHRAGRLAIRTGSSQKL